MFKSYNVSENNLFDKTSKGSKGNNFMKKEIDFALSEKPNNILNQTGDNNETSPTPRIDNIGVDGSQRYSDISKGHIIPHNNPNITDSIINFDPKRDLMGHANFGDRESQNPNLFSQIMTSIEVDKIQQLLSS